MNDQVVAPNDVDEKNRPKDTPSPKEAKQKVVFPIPKGATFFLAGVGYKVTKTFRGGKFQAKPMKKAKK